MDFRVTARKPEGGFVFIPVPQICAVWCAYTHGLLHWLDVRVWCAVHELVARRCHCRPGTMPCYTHAELVPLLGHPRGLASAVQRLTTGGFMTWQREAIGFGFYSNKGTFSLIGLGFSRSTLEKRKLQTIVCRSVSSKKTT
jgi:hypothetical protein